MSGPPLLEVKDLHVRFPVDTGLFGRTRRWVHAVGGVSFHLEQGEAVGLVGESGCGKTTLGRALLRLTPLDSGTVRLRGVEISGKSESEFRPFRRRVQMIFQDPSGTLDPRMSVGESIGEALDAHGLAGGRDERRRRIAGLLESVGLDPGQAERFPHEFSGGQRQRIGIARALAVEPELLVCDEPVSALDLSVQAQVINLLQDLGRQRGLAYLFISHDLSVVAHICRRVLVLYLGRVVESGPTGAVMRNPAHPYTRALVSAVPEIDPLRRLGRIRLGGDLPSPIDPPPGCPFHPRCLKATDRCRSEAPSLAETAPGRLVACHFPEATDPGVSAED
jgi:oligopeptide/dipeptide ABC transporter ATP-binding protein